MARVVKDIDRGMSSILKETRDFEKTTIKVGFQEGSVTETAVKGEREKEGGESMPQIASDNEFGTTKTVAGEFGTIEIPPRPFMRTSFDENKKKISKFIRFQYDKVLKGGNAKKSIDSIGIFVVDLIKNKIIQIKTPPNHPKTIRKKGSSNPLIDFGQMISKVTYAVRK